MAPGQKSRRHVHFSVSSHGLCVLLPHPQAFLGVHVFRLLLNGIQGGDALQRFCRYWAAIGSMQLEELAPYMRQAGKLGPSANNAL